MMILQKKMLLVLHMPSFVISLNSTPSAKCKVQLIRWPNKLRGVLPLLCKGLAENGIEVLLSSGVVPTPVLSFATMHNGCTSGIMVTGGDLRRNTMAWNSRGRMAGPFTSEATAKIKAFFSSSPKNLPVLQARPIKILH